MANKSKPASSNSNSGGTSSTGNRAQRRHNRKTKPNSSYLTDKNSTKASREAKEIEDTAYAMSKRNDVSWYTNFPNFAKDAATLPFSNILGARLDINAPGARNNTTMPVIPGFMRLGFYPTIGVTKDRDSAINRSVMRFYTLQRSVMKASSSYEPAEIVMLLLALDSCYMFHALMRRAYSVARSFTPINRYYNRALLTAMGFNPSICDNLAMFRAYINEFAIMMSQFAAPSDFDIFKRHQWMCEGLYTDGVSDKAQTYVFVPEGFWKFDALSPTGSSLTWVEWGDSTQTNLPTKDLGSVVAFGNALLTPLRGNQDVGQICGDIYTLYRGNVFQLPETPDNYQILPVYNELVLSQIENIKFSGPWASTYVPKITQNPTVNNGAIIFEPKTRGHGIAYWDTATVKMYEQSQCWHKCYLNSRSSNPTPEWVMEATRLTYTGTIGTINSTDPKGISINITACGTELVVRAHICTFSPDLSKTSSTFAFLQFFGNTFAIDGDNPKKLVQDNLNDQLEALCYLSEFDWHPVAVLCKWNELSGDTVGTFSATTFVGDVGNLALTDNQWIDNLHSAALLSLFDIQVSPKM